MSMCVDTWEGQEKVSDPLQLKLRWFLPAPRRCQELNPDQSSVRAASAPNHLAISPTSLQLQWALFSNETFSYYLFTSLLQQVLQDKGCVAQWVIRWLLFVPFHISQDDSYDIHKACHSNSILYVICQVGLHHLNGGHCHSIVIIYVFIFITV